MAVYEDREAFIPYRREDLIQLCLDDGKLGDADRIKFQNFCHLLSAFYHFRFHKVLETLKTNYAPFNPDAATKYIRELIPQQKQNMEVKLVSTFVRLLERANYISVPETTLRKAFREKSLLNLNTQVDFNDFEQMQCYYRGDIYQTIKVKKWWRWIEQEIDIFERVVLLLKFKDTGKLNSKKSKIEQSNFAPDRIYLSIYKNIPKLDMEFLFPNVQVSMTWKDRLLFLVPAIGAAIPAMLKVLPQLLLIIGVILFVTVGTSPWEQLRVSERQLRDLMPVMVATLSLIVTLGGFAFKQYTSYQHKQLKFQVNVTDTLFFRNLAINAGVFNSLLDQAEEEECKEIILVYYHLLTNKELLNPGQLDNVVENWMDEKLNTKIDFDISTPLHNLEKIKGKILSSANNRDSATETPLLRYDEQGNCLVLPLQDALAVIDYLWDNAFLYNHGAAK